jgi:hypothetical protein
MRQLDKLLWYKCKNKYLSYILVTLASINGIIVFIVAIKIIIII